MARMKVTNRVRELRTQQGLTQEQLARIVGVSRQTIISIEKGQYVASLPLALKLARFLDHPTDAVFALHEGTKHG